MTRLEFIAAVVGSLAWPSAVFGMVLILRRPIASVIESIATIRYKGLRLDFRERLDALEQDVEALASPPHSHVSLPAIAIAPETVKRINQSLTELVSQLAPVSPESAVLTAWQRVELAIDDRLARIGDEPRRHLPVKRKLEILREHGVIDEQSEATIRRLQELRNAAAHPGWWRQIATDDAIQYGRVACQIMDHLNLLGGR